MGIDAQKQSIFYAIGALEIDDFLNCFKQNVALNNSRLFHCFSFRFQFPLDSVLLLLLSEIIYLCIFEQHCRFSERTADS